MDLFTSIVYGTTQGVTEFLLVSSRVSCLNSKVFKSDRPWCRFDLMMHVGTASAIVVYFSKEVKALISELFILIKSPMKLSVSNKSILSNSLATFITGTIALFIKREWRVHLEEEQFIIGSNLVVFGILMFISDRNKNNDKHIDVKKSLLIALLNHRSISRGIKVWCYANKLQDF